MEPGYKQDYDRYRDASSIKIEIKITYLKAFSMVKMSFERYRKSVTLKY